MRFLCDEGVERHIVELLRENGYDVLYVAELSPSISDEDVLSLASQERSILMTSDKDFGELVFRRGQAHEGVVLLRLHGLEPAEKARAVLSVVIKHAKEFVNAFAVVEPDRVRIRRGKRG